MSRLTNKEQAEVLSKKEGRTLDENIYLKLAIFENEQENKTLFNKEQFNFALIKSVEMVSNIVKNKITKEIVVTFLNELKGKARDGKLNYSDAEWLGKEIIKKVENSK